MVAFILVCIAVFAFAVAPSIARAIESIIQMYQMAPSQRRRVRLYRQCTAYHLAIEDIDRRAAVERDRRALVRRV